MNNPFKKIQTLFLTNFIKKIHPDLFQSHPNEKTINTKCLATLGHLIDQLNQSSFDYHSRVPKNTKNQVDEPFQDQNGLISVSFYIKNHHSTLLKFIQHKLIFNCQHPKLYSFPNQTLKDSSSTLSSMMHKEFILPPLLLKSLNENQQQLLSKTMLVSSLLKMFEKASQVHDFHKSIGRLPHHDHHEDKHELNDSIPPLLVDLKGILKMNGIFIHHEGLNDKDSKNSMGYSSLFQKYQQESNGSCTSSKNEITRSNGNFLRKSFQMGLKKHLLNRNLNLHRKRTEQALGKIEF